MLDDLRYIHERDQWQQLTQAFELPADFHPDNIHDVVFAGMGGSALCAQIMRSWPETHESFEVVRDYDIPAYVNGSTLFVASSYSGNTEETLSALAQAEEKGAVIAVIASGGKLADIAREKNYPLALLPKVDQPRYSVLSGLKASLTVLHRAGLVQEAAIAELEAAAEYLQKAVEPWLPTVPTKDNPAKQLALECIGKSIVVYAGPKLAPAAYKWKISFNENAKQIAWWNQYPEFNHNEFLGWSKQPVDKPYAIIELKSNLEHERVQKRFEVSGRLLSGLWPHPHVVEVQGKKLVEQLLWALAFGDFVTLYTGLLNGLDPAPVELVEKLKHEL
jgi:glucose/mannose-6-phosphate isomerase